jgi:c-di-GMP-binding flagellar brake protein YcgR
MDSQNRRTNRRATVQLLVSEVSGGKLFMPLLADLSEHGLLLESPAGLEMPRDHAPVVELMLPGVPEIIYARCQVLRDSDHGFFKKRALRFVNISAMHQKLVRMYVQRVCGIC